MNLPSIDKKNLYPLILTFILVILLINSARSISKLENGIRRLDNSENRLIELQAQNKTMKKKIEYANSNEYVEKAALEELNLTKPGMNILIIDPIQPESKKNKKEEENFLTPNYKKWLTEFGFL